MRHGPWIVAPFLLSAVSSAAQDGWRMDFAQRLEELNAYVRFADTLSDAKRWDDTLDVNATIAELLSTALEVPGLSDAAIDSVFANGRFSMATSADGRLRILSWDERTGGTFRSQASVIRYRRGNGVGTMRSTADLEGDQLCGLGAGYDTIHVLRSDTASTLYACMGFVVGCATCCADVVSLLELGPDGLVAPMGLFTSDAGRAEQGAEGAGPSDPYEGSCFTLETRCGDRLAFEYDAHLRVLSFAYMTDDLTPVPQEEGEESRMVTGRLRFDGERFVVE